MHGFVNSSLLTNLKPCSILFFFPSSSIFKSSFKILWIFSVKGWCFFSICFIRFSKKEGKLIHTYFLVAAEDFQASFHLGFWHVVSAVGSCLISSFCWSAESSEQLLNGQRKRNVPVSVKHLYYTFGVLKIAGD